jgi:serine/threonine protein kinase
MSAVERVPDLPNPNQCPTAEVLVAYNTGNLPSAPMGAVARHLERCARCLGRLESLDITADPLVARLGQPSNPPPFTDEECRHVVERVRLLCRNSWLEDYDTPPPAVTDPNLHRIGPYEILELLGRGGMGAVFKARHVHLGKVMALKVLPADRPRSQAATTCLLQEMKAVGRLNHPNIVQAHDADVEGVPYLAMEFIEGADLGKVVRARGPLPVADACECVRQAALGLQHAHENGLVHRDVKPSNLMLTPEGTVKLLDLGLARLHEAPGPIPLQTGLTATPRLAPPLLGTVEYMAPEQFLDCHRVDIRADLYSLGCTFYFLLTGRSPFGAPGLSAQARMEAHLGAPVPPVTLARPEVPEGVAAVLDRLLVKRPEDRFATPAALAAALQPFTAGAVPQRLLPPAESLRPRAPVGPTAPTRLAMPSNRPRARSLAPVVGVAFVLAVVATAAVVVVRGLRRPDPPAPSGPLQVEAFQLTHLRASDGADFSLGELGQACPAAGADRDGMRATARFNRPAYCYLLAFRPDGKEELCWPTRPDQPPEATNALTYPPGGVYRLREVGQGAQAFVLVASSRPLPAYSAWRAEHGAAPWRPAQTEGVWRFDGRTFTRAGRPDEDGPRAEANRPSPEFELLCRFYQTRPEVDSVRAVLFPVQAHAPRVGGPHTP